MSEDRTTLDNDDEQSARTLARRDDLLGRKGSKFRQHLEKVGEQVRRAFADQADRADRLMDFWNAYECKLGPDQFYHDGEAEIFIPIIRDAIDAITTRDSNQLFPAGAQYVEAFSTDGSTPKAIVSLLDEYHRLGDLSLVAKSLIRTGLVEGHYFLYVDWGVAEREIVSRETRGATVNLGGEAVEVPGEEIEDVTSEIIRYGRPVYEVLHDSDVVIYPASADTIEEALAADGFVAICRRWSEGKIKALKKAGIIREDEANVVLKQMEASAQGQRIGEPPDVEKELIELAGIRKKGKELTAWEVWKLEPLSDKGSWSERGDKRIVRIFFASEKMPIGAARNPHWNDQVPLGSYPLIKIPGVAKGRSPVEAVYSLQLEANDAANEGADVAHRTASPVVMADPAAVTEPLIVNIGTLWKVDPTKVKFVEFPDMTPRAISRIQYCIQQVFQSLGVNPSMLPQQTSQARRNQAQIAQEQQIDLLTVAERIRVQEALYTWLVGWEVDLDYQYRDDDLVIRTHGAMGLQAAMEKIPPFKTREYYRFRWWGADNARFNAQQYQQMTAFMNVISSPNIAEQLGRRGYEVDFVPLIEMASMAILGPRYGDKVIKDIRQNLSIDPEIENQFLSRGDMVPISLFDQHQAHIQSHERQAQQTGDPHGAFRAHNLQHMLAMAAQQKAQLMAAMGQQMAANQEGQAPRQGQRQRPVPRPGSQPTAPRRGPQQPPGLLRPEQIPAAGGVTMPRRS